MCTSLTFDEEGKAIIETQDGVNYPAELTFDCVNIFVHSTEVQFEELQWLCLGLVAELEKTKKPET